MFMKSGLPFSIYIVKSQSKKGVCLNSGMRHKSDKYGISNVAIVVCERTTQSTIHSLFHYLEISDHIYDILSRAD